MKPREPRAYAVDLTASVIAHGRNVGEATVANISASGALLICLESFAVGDQVMLSLRAVDDRNAFAVWAVVVRVDSGRIAVTFQPGRARRRLESFVRDAVAREQARQPSVYLVAGTDDACTALERDLRALGLSVETARTPLEVIHHVEQFNLAAVVVDAALGLELLSIIADTRPDIRRVVFNASEPRDEAAVSGLAHALLPIPWDRNSLASALLISS